MIFDRAFWVIMMFRLESQNWLTIMIQFDYSIAWEVASETHCTKYGVEIANQTFIKRKLWHLTKKNLVFVTKWKKWEGEQCYKVYIKVHKATRWTIRHGLMLPSNLDYPDFSIIQTFSLIPFFPEYLLAMIEIRSHIF